jgi:signal transduction histidine kinase/ActR/RegA family two-component response regulator
LGKQITERRRAEEALRESEARSAADLEAMTRLYDLGTRLLGCDNLQAALDDVLQGAILASQADFGNVQLYNPQIGALEIVAQRGFRQDFLDYFRTVRVDEGSACAQAMQSGKRIVIEDVELDPSYEPHRSIAAAAGYRGVQSTPLKSRTGSVVGMLSTHFRQPHCPSIRDQRFLDLFARLAADLIERVRSDEALGKQTERLRLLWQAAAVLLTADDPDAMLRSLFARIGPHLGLDTYFNFMVNEAGDALRLESCTGIPEATARSISRLEFGQAICGTVAEQRQPLVATFIQQSDDPKAQLVKSFGIRAYACNPLLAEGRLLGTLSFASRTREQFDADELEFLRTITHHVTVAYERLRLVKELRDTDRRKDEFLAMLAHELRNPLAPIRNAVQVLRLRGPLEPALQTARDMIDRQVGHMARLVDDLLDVSRISRGKINLRCELVELAGVVASAVESSRPLIETRRHDLQVELPAGPVRVQGDHTRLAQVVLNLLNNSAKYTPEGGHIRLAVSTMDHQAVVQVHDDGVGIGPELLPRVFDLFTQAERTLDRAQGGLGIGLTLVKKLTEMHGGTVEVHSAGPGRGSAFVLHLPLLSQEADGAKRNGEGGAVARGRSAARRILVVDDNQDAADSLAMLLGVLGNDVRTAGDGWRAVEVAGEYRPDLVFLDIGLPGMDGYAVARKLRALPALGGSVLVAVTGYGSRGDRRRSEEAGFYDHMVKPVDFAAIEELLTALPTRTT